VHRHLRYLAAVVPAVILVGLAGCAADSDDPAGTAGTAAAAGTTPSPVGDAAEPAGGTPASTGTAAAGAACDDPPCYGPVEALGALDADVVEQVSGMAASHRTPGLFYVVSDTPGTSAVAVVEDDGTLVVHIEIEGMSSRNAEALAVGPCADGGPDSCLYIGDIGNHVGHEDLFIYRFAEPDLTDPPSSIAADRLRFTYPDAPTDAEALIVDGTGRPLIISKPQFDGETGQTGATRLYRGGHDGGALEDLGEIDLPDPVSGLFAGMVGHVVTGADALDGRVILRTYDEVYEYVAPHPDTDPATFPDWPVRRVPAPFQVQSETVAYRMDGCGYLTTSEPTGAIDAVTCE
jgi:hypothetical protein